MKLENQVCSLELSKKLKELGVKQESVFDWCEMDEDMWMVLVRRPKEYKEMIERYGDDYGCVSAFTVAELGEMLPDRITAEQLNTRFPIRENDDEADLARFDDIQNVLNADYGDVMDLMDGFGETFSYHLKKQYSQCGKGVTYYQLTDEWETNYALIEVEGDTEANARAKMLIYLLENNLLTTNI